MKIYLAGSVPKGDKEAEKQVDWRKGYSETISKISSDLELFNPYNFYINSLEGNPKLVFGAECFHIKYSDLIIVNAESKEKGIGAGTAMEFVIAKYFNKPVITVLPKDSYHRRSNLLFCGKLVEDWVHPFIDSLSDVIVEDISEIGEAIKSLESKEIKKISVIDEYINNSFL